LQCPSYLPCLDDLLFAVVAPCLSCVLAQAAAPHDSFVILLGGTSITTVAVHYISQDSHSQHLFWCPGHEITYELGHMPPQKAAAWKPRTKVIPPSAYNEGSGHDGKVRDHGFGDGKFAFYQSLWSIGAYSIAVRRENLRFFVTGLTHDLSFGAFGTSFTPKAEPPSDGRPARNHCRICATPLH